MKNTVNTLTNENIWKYEGSSYTHNFVGNCLPSTFLGIDPMMFVDDKDTPELKQSLKSGEIVLRYETYKNPYRSLIKVNPSKMMVYFLSEETLSGETDEIIFETKGIKCKYMNILSEYIK